MPSISVLIKPSSSNCNIRCKYCFYHSIAEKRDVNSYGMIEMDTMETIVKKAMEYSDFQCNFAFQGGEPTLRGLEFYKEFIELQKKYNTKNLKISNSIQTNGMVLDDEWCKFLAENNFLVGISLDGYMEIHDENRVDPKGQGTFSRVKQSIDLMDKYNVQYNILCVVTSTVARHINKVYKFYKKNNFRYLQFIPCIDYSLKVDQYEVFLKRLFDLWYEDLIKGDYTSIRYFDNLVSMYKGFRAESCGMSGSCACQLVIEADGSVYPCDFYVTDYWKLGNIKDYEFKELILSDKTKEFILSSQYIDPKCRSCKWLNICRGGCRRYREPFIEGKPSLSTLCKAYEGFFEYAHQRLVYLARYMK